MESSAGVPCCEAARFRLSLFGGFDLRHEGGGAALLPTRKAQLLLAYLALPAGLAHSREKLAGLFWGERQEEQARGSLRNGLAAIRALLGAGALGGERDTVELVPGLIGLDVDRLAAAAAGREDVTDEFLGLVLRTELLEGGVLPSESFAEWLAFERMRCRGLATAATQKAIAAHRQAGRFGPAIELGQRLVALDPLREQSHRLLIECYAASGERSRAMTQFQNCQDVLSRELGVQPSVETTTLLRRIADAPDLPAVPVTASEPLAAQSAPAPTSFSIAVLPFVNLGGDPDQNFMAEGFSEDLITELSRRRDFSVIARQSSYLFSGRPETASVAAAELSARYALAGSLRRAGERLRVTAQLIDSAGNRCIWAERYDRAMADIFAMQDEIVAGIVDRVDAEVRQDERERAARRLPRELDAWELFHRGLWHVYRFTRDDVAAGEELFRRAVERAPDFALPHAGLGYAAFVRAVWYFAPDPRPVLAEGIGHAETAVVLDGENAFGHFALGRLLTLAGEIGRALHHLRLAIAFNPSFAQAHFGLAQALVYAAQPAQALASIETALKLSPKDPLSSMFLTLRSFCHYSLGDYAAAEVAGRTATQLQMRETWSRLALAAALVELGRVEEARRAVAEARRIEPALSLESFGRLVRPVSPALRERVWAALRAAGIEAQPDA
ncbi:BTAD domain-containing putative transcriptional regulator [Bosea sp. (in: a-proteobacteria)]|uniref:BTAD domain-containing putative transcriptional regulator n=1 Tax=Bosea sp. (in: a-proteobacteria) TaxID=1871050 RepID=UPI002FCC57F5